jgi:hypothetical protein
MLTHLSRPLANLRIRGYTAVDEIPAHVDPFLYERLEEWGFDGAFIHCFSGARTIVECMLTRAEYRIHYI